MKKPWYDLPNGLCSRFGFGALVERAYSERALPGQEEFREFLRGRYGVEVCKSTAFRMLRELKDVRGEP